MNFQTFIQFLWIMCAISNLGYVVYTIHASMPRVNYACFLVCENILTAMFCGMDMCICSSKTQSRDCNFTQVFTYNVSTTNTKNQVYIFKKIQFNPQKSSTQIIFLVDCFCNALLQFQIFLNKVQINITKCLINLCKQNIIDHTYIQL